MSRDPVTSFYVRTMAMVLRKPARAVAFALASIMHAAGHALLALAAGAVTVALVSGRGASWVGSTSIGNAGSLANQAFSLSLLGLAAVVVKSAGGVYASYVQARIAGDVGSALRLDVLDGLLSVYQVRRARHSDHGVAERAGAMGVTRGVAALTAHVREVEMGLHVGLLGGMRALAQLAPLVGILLWLAPKLALVALLIFVPFSAALTRVRRRWKRANARGAREAEALLEAADEAVRHCDLWVTYGAEDKVRGSVASLGRAMTERSAVLEASAAALSGANEVLGALALLGAMAATRAGLLGASVERGATLLAFAVAFFLAYKPLRDLADARLALARASAAYEDVGEIARLGQGLVAPLAARAWPLASLELRSVALARGSLAPLSLTVGAGEIVAIVGPTGIGKTTLLRTLLGLEAAESGEILFDGAALDDAAAGPRARPFAWVPQDAPLLADTLAANVALGAPDDGTGDARAALDPIGAAHLAESLDGARLGAAGRAVSGGERQWIALARALATRLPVLLLDEPTSGLDAQAQARVLEGIARLRGSRTVLMVTHRSEPLAIADRVVRLENQK